MISGAIESALINATQLLKSQQERQHSDLAQKVLTTMKKLEKRITEIEQADRVRGPKIKKARVRACPNPVENNNNDNNGSVPQ